MWYLIDINRHLSESLNCIGMEQNAVFFCNFTDLFDGLNGSDLVVGKHHRDQDGVRADGFFQFIQLDNTVFIHIQVGNLKALFLQPLAGMQNGMMLNLAGDDVFSFALISFCSSF